MPVKVNTSLKVVEPAAGKRQSMENVASSCDVAIIPAGADAGGTTTAAVDYIDDDLPLPPPTPPPTLSAAAAVAAAASATAVTVVYVPYPGDCCPKTSWKYWCWEWFVRTTVGDRWWTYRCYCKRLVDHRYFESFVIFMIMTSSISLVTAC